MYRIISFCAVGFLGVVATPTKVLLLGDSITFGCGSSCRLDCMKTGDPDCAPCAKGWRGPLWNMLAGNVNTSAEWDFVGTQTTGDPATMDVHHEGHPGWKNEDILGIINNWAPLNPDIMTLHLGTNNMGVLGLQSAETALGNMDNLLNNTFARLPNVRLLLSTLIGANRITYGGTKHAAYNDGIRDFVKKYSAAGRKIELVDMASESGIGEFCDSTNCCPLRIHPNDIGYAHMAKVWHKHLVGGSFLDAPQLEMLV